MGADAKILTALTSPKTSPLHNARAHSFGSISCHPADTRTVLESTWDSEHRLTALEMLEESQELMEPGVDENVAKATVTKDTYSLQNDSDQSRDLEQDPEI